MKRLFLTAMLLMAFAMAGFSQTGVYYGGVGSRTLREAGWIIKPELGIMGLRHYDFPIGTNIGVGNQITPHVYVGVGMGFFMERFKSYSYTTGLYGFDDLETFYSSVRWYWLDLKSSPFLELNLGIGRFYYSTSHYGNLFYDYDDYHLRPWITLAVGYDIRNFDINVGMLAYGDGLGVFATVGYNFLIKKR